MASMKVEFNEQRELILSDVFSGIGIKTDQGTFGIAQRDGGIEIVKDGKLLWSSMGGAPRPLSFNPERPFTSRIIEILHRADEIAADRRSLYLDSLHLLLGMIDNQEWMKFGAGKAFSEGTIEEILNMDDALTSPEPNEAIPEAEPVGVKLLAPAGLEITAEEAAALMTQNSVPDAVRGAEELLDGRIFDDVANETEREISQLGACLIAAKGSTIIAKLVQGDYSWSPAFEAVKELWEHKEQLSAIVQRQRENGDQRIALIESLREENMRLKESRKKLAAESKDFQSMANEWQALAWKRANEIEELKRAVAHSHGVTKKQCGHNIAQSQENERLRTKVIDAQRRIKNLDGSLEIAVESNQKLQLKLEKSFATIEELRKAREKRDGEVSKQEMKLAEENMDCHDLIEKLQNLVSADAGTIKSLNDESQRLRDSSSVKALALLEENLGDKRNSVLKQQHAINKLVAEKGRLLNTVEAQKEQATQAAGWEHELADCHDKIAELRKSLEAERAANADKVQIIERQCQERRAIKAAVGRGDMAAELQKILNPPESDESESVKKTETEIKTIVLDAGPDHLKIVEIANVTALRAERDQLKKSYAKARDEIIRHTPCTCPAVIGGYDLPHAPTCRQAIAREEFPESP